MKKEILIIFLLILFSLTIISQPSNTKKTVRSVLQLKTFDERDNLIGNSIAFYVDENGSAVSCCQPFLGAYRAVVIDYEGKEYAVDQIIGGSEIYDVVKFQVSTKKSTPLVVSTGTVADGSPLWMLSYRDGKNLRKASVRKSEKFASSYDYYTLAMTMPEHAMGSPMVDERGQVVGLLQPSANKIDTLCYAVSARFADSLKIQGLSLNDATMRSIHIRKALPEQLDQAVLMLYVGSSSLDSLGYVDLIERFIHRFPKAHDGYQHRAELAFNRQDFAGVQRDMEEALRQADNKAAVHYSYGRFIYQKELLYPKVDYPAWSLEKALQEEQEAYKLDAQPIYRYQQALILYVQKKYQETSDIYEELFSTTLRSANLFYEASKCREALNDTVGQIALLDSAVNTFSRPFVQQAAPFLLVRAKTLIDVGDFRKAVLDLNDYESLMKGRLSDGFYYLRYQAELGGKMYQQALDDIAKAQTMRPEHDIYYSEQASLQLRVGLIDEAMATANQLIGMVPDQSDGYLFLGIAQCIKGNKKDGLLNLKKAEQMGDTQATDFIKKYQ
ncbi:MAG: serine protease [Prevotella sp.]|nr:serine protease [Prevotella sp.]